MTYSATHSQGSGEEIAASPCLNIRTDIGMRSRGMSSCVGFPSPYGMPLPLPCNGCLSVHMTWVAPRQTDPHTCPLHVTGK